LAVAQAPIGDVGGEPGSEGMRIPNLDIGLGAIHRVGMLELDGGAGACRVDLFDLEARLALAAAAREVESGVECPDVASHDADIDLAVVEGDGLDRGIVEIRVA